MNQAATKTSLWNLLGPGLLYAGAAIGVSHLVQSTRAGAEFGYDLLWAVLIANLLKFPFFEMGPRYAAATGKSLLHGYRQLGQWAVALFGILTICTMFVIQAAVTVVTAGLAMELTGIELSLTTWSLILLSICGGLILLGRYSVLDQAIKIIIITLTISTIVALCAALFNSPTQPGPFVSFSLAEKGHFLFLIALMGWMPAPLDISVWHSVWSVNKHKGAHGKGTLKNALLDFKVGYWGTAILAICFLSLGAIMMYGSGEAIPTKAGGFASALLEVYTESLGSGAYWIIAVAAFTTMFSTTLTCLDAFPRVLTPTTLMLLQPEEEESTKVVQWNRIWLLITILGTLIIVAFFMTSMTDLVDFVTVLSFLAAPLLAILNYLVIYGPHFPAAMRPGILTKILTWLGLVFLVGFSGYYLVLKFVLS